MNERAQPIRQDGRNMVLLPDGIELGSKPLQVRVVGRTILLEPVPEDGGLAPGFYTKATLPPLSEGARAILASVDAAVSRLETAKAVGGESRFETEDAAVAIVPSDEPSIGIDPDA